MKTFLRFLLFLFLLCITVNAQWISQHEFTGVNSIGGSWAVDDVYWGYLEYSTGNLGYFKTTDSGITWSDGVVPIAGFISSIYARNASTAYLGVSLASGEWRILKTTDGGTSWFEQFSAAFSYASFIDFIYFFDENNGVTVGDPVGGYLEIYTTTDGGENWVRVPDSNIPPAYANEMGTQMLFGANENSIWVPTYKENPNSLRIFKSTDRGSNWTVSDDLPNPMPTGQWPYPTSIAFVNPNDGLLLITNWTSPGPSSYYKMFKTDNGGNDWIEMNFPLSITPAYICSIPGSLQAYLVTAPLDTIGTAYSLDGGNTWQSVEDTLGLAGPIFGSIRTGWAQNWDDFVVYKWSGPPLPVELTSFTAITNGKGVIINWSTATELNNLGFEVQRSYEGADFVTVGMVYAKGTTTDRTEYSYIDKNLVDGKYYYRLKQVDYNGSYEYSDVVEIEWRAFNSYLLEQNWPNPFNPSTTIGFGIQNKSNVTITVLNLIGEEVAVVVSEERQPGYYQVEFNASSLPSGVYFYQIIATPNGGQAGSFVQTKKMILLR